MTIPPVKCGQARQGENFKQIAKRFNLTIDPHRLAQINYRTHPEIELREGDVVVLEEVKIPMPKITYTRHGSEYRAVVYGFLSVITSRKGRYDVLVNSRNGRVAIQLYSDAEYYAYKCLKSEINHAAYLAVVNSAMISVQGYLIQS